MKKGMKMVRFIGIVCWFLALFILINGHQEKKKEAEEAAEQKTAVPDLLGMTLNEGKNALFQAGLSAEPETEGETITGQTPPAGESVNKGTKVLLRME